MNNIFNISEMTALALHTVLGLAGSENKISVSELAEKLDASKHTLHKVVTKLVEKDIVHSTKGVGGGCMLAKPAHKIKLLDIVEAIEGKVNYKVCLFKNNVCKNPSKCIFAELTIDLKNQVIAYYKNNTIQDLLNKQ